MLSYFPKPHKTFYNKSLPFRTAETRIPISSHHHPRTVSKTPQVQETTRPPPSPPAQTIPRPTSLQRVVLQRIEVLRKRRSSSPVSSQLANKRYWHSSSPKRHSTNARNLREVELRISELETEVQRLTPKVAAAASELKALRGLTQAGCPGLSVHPSTLS